MLLHVMAVLEDGLPADTNVHRNRFVAFFRPFRVLQRCPNRFGFVGIGSAWKSSVQ